jgi:hypothetical protein
MLPASLEDPTNNEKKKKEKEKEKNEKKRFNQDEDGTRRCGGV